MEAESLISETLKKSPTIGLHQLNIFAVPFPYLISASSLINSRQGFAIAAQNCSSFAQGAYTGEVSAAMLASMQIPFCLVGHSERRAIFNEATKELLEKINLLLQNGIRPIWCCGENLEQRNSNVHFEVIAKQIKEEIFKLNDEAFSKIIIAYEPVWAIGTGLTATSAQAQEMHHFIRKEISNKYNIEVANQTSILYGGSCNAENSEELFSQADVDGGLIGGASLKSESFVKLILSMHELH